MKKRVITGIIAAVLGVVTLSPVAASAEEFSKYDIDHDSGIDNDDWIQLRDMIYKKAQTDEDGTLLAYVRGDVNGDGRLTNADLEILRDIETDNAEGMKAADVNEDGKINGVDFIIVKKAIEKKGQIDKGGKILDYIIGDVDGNHVVDKEDLILLKKQY